MQAKVLVEKILVLVFIVLFNLGAATDSTYARDGDTPQSDLKFTHLTTSDGLSQNTIFTIVQDHQGFMWFATRDGLNRYDGNTFVVYKHDPDDPESLSANYIHDLIEDDQGYLWIGTAAGVNRYDPTTERFTRYRHDPDNPNSLSGDSVISVIQDSRGHFWFGTGGNGLNKFDPATGTFIRYRNDSEGEFVERIMDVTEDSEGNIWFVGDRGLHHVNSHTGQITRPPATIDRLQGSHVFGDKVGNLWILAFEPDSLFKYDPQAEQLTEYPLDIPGALLGVPGSNLLDDGQQGFWVPSGNGLYHFDRQTKGFTLRFRHDETDPDSLSNNIVSAVYRDRAGLLWLGTENGGVNILNFQQEQFATYRHHPNNPNSISPGRVTEIYEDPKGILWLGFYHRALNRFDLGTGQITRYVPDPDNDNTLSRGTNINSIYKDAQGYLWLGGWDSGLNRFDERSGQFKHYRHNLDDPNSLISNHVLDIHEAHNDTLWVGQYGGLSRFDPTTERFTNYQPDPDDRTSLGLMAVRIIYRDRSGVLWLGTWGGVLSRFDDGTETFRNYRPDARDPHTLNGGSVYAIHEDRTGILWVGASDGLFRFNRKNETFTRYTDAQGLPSSSILGILEDNAGRLWLSTRNGLSRFDPRTETFRNYDVADGLQGNDFSESCYEQGQSGKMFFCGSEGFNAFFPEKIRDNLYVPPVVITDFKIFNKPVPVGADSVLQQAISYVDTLTLSYQDDIFSFEFAALSYANSEKNRYRYKLEGFEPDWNEVGSDQRLAIYTNLDPGHYVFRVQGSNSDGVWNEKGVSLPITITPPWWQTWWFRALAAVLVAGAIAGAFIWQQQNAQRRHRVLEFQVAERTQDLKIARDEAETAREKAEIANQAKSVFLANMSHELRTPLNAILGYANMLKRPGAYTGSQTDGLDIIRRSGEHLLTLINDVLDLAKIEAGKLELNPAPLHLPTFLHEIIDIIRARAEAKGLSLTYEALSPLPNIVQTDEKRLRQVLLNLLGNAVKFNDRGSVVLTVEALGDSGNADVVSLRFRVEDTGTGIAPDQLARIFLPFEQTGEAGKRAEGTGLGLAISQQIVQEMGAQLHVESELGRGSAFWFDATLPVKEAPLQEGSTQARAMVGYEGARRKVLVVDDKPYNRLLLVDLLQPLGFEVNTAEDGQQAVDKALAWRPDAIVMDVMMPAKSGLEAAREIRQRPELTDVYIIATSASVFEPDREKSRIAGCDAFLPKPIKAEQLLDLLAKPLGLARIYAETEAESKAPLVPPPPEELATLYQFIDDGRILDIQALAIRLEKKSETYLPFARKLQELARGYQINEIKIYVEQLMEAQAQER